MRKDQRAEMVGIVLTERVAFKSDVPLRGALEMGREEFLRDKMEGRGLPSSLG